jgi:SAM-dependent methyltransferase
MRAEGVARRLFRILDRAVGRGSYAAVRRHLDPNSEYTQITYGRLLEESLNTSAKWLDAGCGHEVLKHGAGTEKFDFWAKPRMAVGCDLDLPSLKGAGQIKNRVCCSLEQLPFRSGTFTVVSLNNVAEHLSDPRKVFAEFARVLSDDGRLVIHTPNVRSYWVHIGQLGRMVLPERVVFRLIKFTEHREEDDVFPTVYRANSKARLMQLAAESGLRVERISLLRSRPLFYFFAPLAVLEILFSRLMMRLDQQEIAAPVLLAVFRRPTREPRSELGLRSAG